MKKYLGIGIALTAALSALISINSIEEEKKAGDSAIGRAEWELERLKDPATGKLPENIRVKELAYAATLPKASGGSLRASVQEYNHAGPYNVGGRTRALAVDVADGNTLIAGGVSGGMYKSTNGGSTWYRTTSEEQHAATSCVAQDVRTGKTNIWYYGSGEVRGNSAGGRSFSAGYLGTGMYKSTDNGESWTQVASTAANDPHKGNDWDFIHNIITDFTRSDSDIVFASIEGYIMRSNDGGDSWTRVLGGSQKADYTYITQASNGAFYASLSTGATNNGFWRSEDGMAWTRIDGGAGIPPHDRTLIAASESSPNEVYFYSYTPGFGNGDASLWHYEYLSGNGQGAGGAWSNRSNGIPNSTPFYTGATTQGAYNMSLVVHPTNPNMVYLGGANLHRSSNGFQSTSTTRQIGGYRVDGMPNYDTRMGIQHPDQHVVVFDPNNANILYAATDGGVHKSTNPTATNMTWSSLNNGFITTQFYGVAVDPSTVGSEIVVGGLQDNGSYWTNTTNSTSPWQTVRGSDGAFVAINDGAQYYYLSTQYANIQRTVINASSGSVGQRTDVMPSALNGASFQFVHPFTLNESNTNEMFLPQSDDVWYNRNLSASSPSSQWTRVASVGNNITAIASCKSDAYTVYAGSSNRQIYRIDNANSAGATVTNITNNISSGTFANCIEVDPLDENKLLVVYSNYNVKSIWYSEDGGQNWTDVEGNLAGTPDPGVPPQLSHIGNGPSFRWAEILHTNSGTVYLVGTSVGVYATNLLKGDSTVWVQQGADNIGNTVIDMIDVRDEDGFVAVGTHGRGVYTTTIDSPDSVTFADQTLFEEAMNLKVYPNPASNQANIEFELNEPNRGSIKLYNMQGQEVDIVYKGIMQSGVNRFNINLDHLPSGTYLYKVRGQAINRAGLIQKL